MPTEIVQCPKCGRRFPNNTEKHQAREKLSPCCRAVYWKHGLHISFNADWLKEKLFAKKMREQKRDMELRGRARHDLKLQYKDSVIEITDDMVEKEFVKLKEDEEMAKMRKKMGLKT